MNSNENKSKIDEPNFDEAGERFDLERLKNDLEKDSKITDAPWRYFKGVLCGYSTEKIADKCGNSQNTIQTELNRNIKPSLYSILNQEPPKKNQKTPWEKVPEWLVQAEYGLKQDVTELSETPSDIDWNQVCSKMLIKQQEQRLFRKSITGRDYGNEVNIDIPVGLNKRKKQPKDNSELNKQSLSYQKIEQEYEYITEDQFLQHIIETEEEKYIAIVGEAGTGKSRWIERIGKHINNNSDSSSAICLSLQQIKHKSVKDYIIKNWLEDALNYIPEQTEVTEELVTSFKKFCGDNQVFILLDGLDEMSLPSNSSFQAIAHELNGWISNARVILTCRANLWEANQNELSYFQTYNTIKFNEEDLKKFINDWFSNYNQKLGEKLKEKLKESNNKSIAELVSNPLLLSILCKNWCNKQGELPTTKFALYENFFNKWLKWKPDLLPYEELDKQEKLKTALAKLAKKVTEQNINITRHFAYKIMGQELLNLALELNLLNQIAEDEETDEKIYAFSHSTFQEYFACLVIDDWDFFLPRQHINKPIIGQNAEDKSYRVFDFQWQEVILFWFGRSDISSQEKETFIEKLTNFDDGCNNFYHYKAYLFAVRAISEFQDCKQAEEIIEQIIDWSFIFDDNQELDPDIFVIREEAQKILLKTDTKKVIDKLINKSREYLKLNQLNHLESILYYFKIKGIFFPEVYDLLKKIITPFEHQEISKINFLYIRTLAFDILCDFDPNNQDLVDTLFTLSENLISNNNSEKKYSIEIVAQLSKINPYTFKKFIELLEKYKEKMLSCTIINVIKELSKLDEIKENKDFIKVLEKIINIENLINDEINKNNISSFSTKRELLEIVSYINKDTSPLFKLLDELLNIIDKLKKGNLPSGIYKNSNSNYLKLGSDYLFINEEIKSILNTLFIISPDCVQLKERLRKLLNYDLYGYELTKISIRLLSNINDSNLEVSLVLIEILKRSDSEFHTHFSDSDYFSLIISEDSQLVENIIGIIENSEDLPLIEKCIEILAQVKPNSTNYNKIIEFLTQTLDECITNIKNYNDQINKFLQRICVILTNLINSNHKNVIGIIINFLRCINDKYITANIINLLALNEIFDKEINLFLLEIIGRKEWEDDDLYLIIADALIISLRNCQREEEIREIIKRLTNYLLTIDCDDKNKQYIALNQVIWNYLQNISYPEFYQIWANSSMSTAHPEITEIIGIGNTTTTQRLNLVQLPELLKKQIENDSDLKGKVNLVCIDTNNFINTNNPAKEIYLEIVKAGFDKSEDGTPKEMEDFKIYWELLNTDKILPILIFYNNQKQKVEFSESVFNALSKIEGEIYVVTDQTISEIPCFSPNEANLIMNIIGRIKQKFLET